MNLEKIDQIAKAVLYEGYMLYPYRPSAIKNRQRFNFGILFPETFADVQAGAEACSLRTECLITGSTDTMIEIRLRFLQLRARSQEGPDQSGKALFTDNWQEAMDREVLLPKMRLQDLREKISHPFSFPSVEWNGTEKDGAAGSRVVIRRQSAIAGLAEIAVENIYRSVFKISVLVRNSTPVQDAHGKREDALLQSLISAHLVLGVEEGAFISLLDAPEELQEFASRCQNVGVWPVLVGEPGACDTLLASPIILYDYPQIAPESAGDLFDGTEIDEILSLRIMTLTDEEKREIRHSDERARHILERTDSMPAEQFMKLHGAVRGMRPLKENTP